MATAVHLHRFSTRYAPENHFGCRATARIMGVGLNTILRHLKNSGRSR
ncbi:IS1-like element transposase [Enterobacter roggenkampii]